MIPARTRVERDRWSVVENWAIVPLAAVVGLALYYWATTLDRLPPIELYAGTIAPYQAPAGTSVTVRWSFRTPRQDSDVLSALGSQSCSAVITREIVDGRGALNPLREQEIQNRSAPHPGVIENPLPVSFFIQYGPAQYRRSACYRCEGITLTRWFPVCPPAQEIPFEIVPPPRH
jgi:hypothetical protein